MLISDLHAIGNRLLAIRRKRGMTQSQVAEAAGLSDRSYAEIERGSVNMRLETMLRICQVLNITPDEILTDNSSTIEERQAALWEQLSACCLKDRETALTILTIFLNSLK